MPVSRQRELARLADPPGMRRAMTWLPLADGPAVPGMDLLDGARGGRRPQPGPAR
jgi:hypothetical protein